jgi:hypothetical protein
MNAEENFRELCMLVIKDVFMDRVAIARRDISENVLSPSSGLFKCLIRFHSCITAETLLLSLRIEGHN